MYVVSKWDLSLYETQEKRTKGKYVSSGIASMLCQDGAVDTANGPVSLKHVLFKVTSNLFAQMSVHSCSIAVKVEALR